MWMSWSKRLYGMIHENVEIWSCNINLKNSYLHYSHGGQPDMYLIAFWPKMAKIVLKLKVVCHKLVQIYIIGEKASCWQNFL